jgi:hypothetical protein
MAFSLGGGYCSAVLYLISNLALLLPPHRVTRKEELSRLSRMNKKLSRAVSVLVNPINISAIAKTQYQKMIQRLNRKFKLIAMMNSPMTMKRSRKPKIRQFLELPSQIASTTPTGPHDVYGTDRL